MDAVPALSPDPDAPRRWRARGDWTLAQAARLWKALAALRPPAESPAESLEAQEIGRLDAAGAWLLLGAQARLGLDPAALSLRPEHRGLVAAIAATRGEAAPVPTREPAWRQLLAQIGGTVEELGRQQMRLLGFLGLSLGTLARTLAHPRRLRITATVHHMERTGLDAVPLVALLSFMIGAVVAYLGATVLRDYGADQFVVELVGFSFLREFGVLLTAILLAGRTASAFAAQIGTMKSREEIDAIRTLGLDPIELLVLPRLLALLLMLPILAVIAAIAGMFGGMLVAWGEIGMPPDLFVSRLHDSLELRHYLVGLAKAPAFATVIALIGCLEGFKVAGSAQSVGERTTSAVVQSISLVIVIDALAAIWFMEMGW